MKKSTATASEPMSFRAKILQLSFKIFLLMGVVGMAAVYALYNFQSRDSQNRTRDYLTRNLEVQINRLLPMFLLQEQWAGTQLILDQIRQEEELSYIAVIPHIRELPAEFRKCGELGQAVKTCLLLNKEDVGVVAPLREGGFEFGYLVKAKSRKGLLSTERFLQLMYLVFVILGAALLVLTFALLRYINKEGKRFLHSLTEWLGCALAGRAERTAAPEFRIREMNELTEKIASLIVEHEEASRQTLLADIAKQVAHDIRSPLAALEMSVRDLKSLPEEKRLLIRSACEEIHDIVNVLRESRARPAEPLPTLVQKTAKLELMMPVVDTLVSEKRLEFKGREEVRILIQVSDEARVAFARIHRGDFKRMMSNLINNAVESYQEGSVFEVTLRMSIAAECLVIEVSDRGRGIAPENLQRIFEKGVSLDKKEGTGLGLYHAQECVRQWGGQLTAISLVGEGTTMRLSIPKVPAPSWFATEIILHKAKKIVVLDDDPTIHMIWKERFKTLLEESLVESVFHFYRGQALLQWWSALPKEMTSEMLFLMDFELFDEEHTGLDLMKKIGLFNQCIFVTSHYDEEELQAECVRLGARMISKNMAGFIPLRSVERGEVQTYVLIDDSQVTRMSWRFRARERNIVLRDFGSIEEFEAELGSLPADAVIYLDSDLGEGKMRGETYAQVLAEKGYRNLYLATGHDPELFESIGCIRGVVTKDPPWL